jgi:deazaflavin-dependent oxidoreductase (nitroreductase family)
MHLSLRKAMRGDKRCGGQRGSEGEAVDVTETNRRVIEQFRSGGPVEGMHRDRLLLLTTTGRRTGLPRTTPVMFERDGTDLVVIASNMGAPAHPQWYLNLVQEPRVVVEVGSERFDAVASAIAGDRRDRVWSMLKARYPFFADHEAGTGRTIPLVALARA